ncbi:acyl-CoA dehydrogenase [Trinickia violacea]|uniref:Acyl-CoA dehydrogenase n=1 Tax=Trinickia violacea TaxID=2571746 RepID=A0A4P8IRK7_9BURK|nr:acyl-CoA dehydrogenase family protein [Trinickia violacea]QCP50345.1 acyl-CoA dehydrogenase [Trinickia violacea]
MSSGDPMLLDSATRLFSDLCSDEALRRAEQGEWQGAHWQAVEDLGLPLALTDEAAGGFGVDPLDALALVRLAGCHALPLPLAETMIANRRLGEAGFEPGAGVTVLVPGVGNDVLALERVARGWRLRGTCTRVPWGRHAARLAALARHEDRLYLVSAPAGGWTSEPGANIAGAPRDTLHIDADLAPGAALPAPHGRAIYAADEAAARALTIAGALERVLSLTVDYARDRVQFGKPIGKFQVIQQNLAVLASQSCAAAAAADLAARAFAAGGDVLPIAIAKARAGEAASIACGLAHQIHGAIGFTAEHRLHYFTKLLWSCRDEGGGEAYWNRQIGLRVARTGADVLWSFLTAI